MARRSNGPDEPKSKLRSAAEGIVRVLVEAGHEAYFAGGCVRDRLMNQEPADYDVATDAHPKKVGKLFRNAQFVGESFGVTLVRHLGRQVHVATFRTDGVYSDGRHPDAVTFSDARHDAERRDFTINGLFENPLTDEVIDYVGGQTDIDGKVVRAIGDPKARIREDALRMLRAVRFAARFEFDLEEQTAEAIRQAADKLRGVSRERIGDELKRMFVHPNRGVAAWTLQFLGLDRAVLDEPHQTPAPQRLGRLPEHADYPTALAAWLLDRHEAGGDLRTRADGWTKALLLSNTEQAELNRCLEIYQALRGPWERLGVAAQKRLAARPEFESALMILQGIDRQLFVDVRRRVQHLAETGLAP